VTNPDARCENQLPRVNELLIASDVKAIMLAWLVHVVGDIHQPLHSSALFSQNLFPKEDHGGNSILTKQHGNLHSLWDGFPGGKVLFKTAHQRALKLMADSELATLGAKAAEQLDEQDWLKESRERCPQLRCFRFNAGDRPLNFQVEHGDIRTSVMVRIAAAASSTCSGSA
jgi:hypothetical protein